MTRKGTLAFGAPLPSPGLQPIRTDLIHARHLGHTLSRVELAHDGNLQFAGILLSGHKHCSPPFNVIGPLNSCLTFGVQSKWSSPPVRPYSLPGLSTSRPFPAQTAFPRG